MALTFGTGVSVDYRIFSVVSPSKAKSDGLVTMELFGAKSGTVWIPNGTSDLRVDRSLDMWAKVDKPRTFLVPN